MVGMISGRHRMRRLFLILLVAASSPAWSQTKPVPKDVAKLTDNCAPIGRTEDGKLVYSMKCATLPAPLKPAPQVQAPQAQMPQAPAPQAEAAPEPETARSGLFGLSYDRRPKD